MPTIKKTASGNYHTSVFIGMVNGKRKYKSITAPTKREVKQQIAEALTENITESTYGALTLSQAYERYINSKSNTLSPSTLREYKRAAKADFPQLLDYKLSQLNNDIIQTAINEISVYNAPKTVKNKYVVLNSVLKAYRPELNLHVRLPQKIKRRPDLHDDDTVCALLNHADDRLRVPIILAAFAGLRREEICALTPDDLKADRVIINKAKVRGEGGYVIKPPKSYAGDRYVPMSADLIKECRQWKHFDCNPGMITENYLKLRRQLGIEATFHKLRHYCATQFLKNALELNLDIMTICFYLGWDDPQMLFSVYAHSTQDELSDKKVVSIHSAHIKKIAMQ